DPAEAEQKLLDLKVCDPACGSGHFLIAAAERMAMHLARLRTGDDQPNTLDVQHAKRDIIGRCIYGVDINPMAVELCKVSLWMEALEPGKPLSFLDHHIQCGNSLLGATPRLLAEGIPDDAFKPIEGDDKKVCADLKKSNKKEREEYKSGQGYLFEPVFKLGNAAAEFAKLTAAADDSLDSIAAKRQRYQDLVKGADYLNARFWADTWCAAFVWKKDESDLGRLCPTERKFRDIERNPHNVLPHVRDEIEELSIEFQLLHWHLAFPDVFRSIQSDDQLSSAASGWAGGFNVMLGNPPWERLKLQEQEFFSTRYAAIAEAPNAASRKRMIAALENEDPALFREFWDAQRHAEGENQLLRSTGRFPFCGVGRDINSASVFAETMRSLLAPDGQAGCVVPSAVVTDNTTKLFFQDLMQTSTLSSVHDFENRNGIFQGVHRSYKFCVMTMVRQVRDRSAGAKFSFFNLSTTELSDPTRSFSLTAFDIALLNPTTMTCPVFRARQDAELTKSIYRRIPVLLRSDGSQSLNPWCVKTRPGLFHMSNHSHLFHSLTELANQSEASGGRVPNGYLPLYEAKMLHQFDHRWATYQGDGSEDMPDDLKRDPSHFSNPRYALANAEVESRLPPSPRWVLGVRDICRSTDERTAISAILPPVGIGGTIMIVESDVSPKEFGNFVGVVDSFVFDYVTRQKVAGTHLNPSIFKQLPFISPSDLSLPAIWHETELCSDWCLRNVLELTYTAFDVQQFAVDSGYDGPPFRWDEERRFQIRCELDAAYFHLYLGFDEEWGADNPTLREMFPTPRDAVDYIMDTFPIVRRKDEAKYDGDYRTKRTILEIYDQMAEAIRTGQPYQTQLNPPPGPPTDKEGNFIPVAQWTPDLNTSHIHPPREAEVSTSRPLVVDPVFPGTELDKMLCACLLDLAQAESALSEDQNLDKVILAMQTERCCSFLTGDDKSQYEESLANVPAVLIGNADGKPPWKLLLSSLLANRSLVMIEDRVAPGDNFDAVRPNLPKVDSQFLSLVAKAAERLREFSEADETDESTRSVVQEVQQQHAAVQAGAIG
ncbi:MAG: hypothetical protein CMN21_17095, partial [Rubinisphaera sp.]|nr:hypothetical protein [Rubinisphaera sp.]